MFNSLFINSLFFVSLLTSTNLSDSRPFTNLEITKQLVVLKSGTTVSLQLNDEVSSEEVEIGNTIEFTVRSNVTVNGKVLIAAGAIAEGWVKDVIKTCEGCNAKDQCAKLVLVVQNVQAVDGQRVNLRSLPYTVKGKCCCGGGPAVAKFGSVLSSRVLNDIKIDA